MKKIMFSGLVALCMIGFTACGSTESSSSAAQKSAQNEAVSQETQAPQAEQTDEEKAVPGQGEEQSENSDDNASSGNGTLVVYFSATGTTKGVAERIEGVTNADIFELIPAEPYSDADLD